MLRRASRLRACVRAKRIAALFAGTTIKFVDAGIIGGPPKEGYDPVFYASANAGDEDVLAGFASLKTYGLNVSLLTGEGMGNVLPMRPP